ncbi:MAG TPA: hypothetical protein VFS23_18870 [Vicinamibacterales bacterium]|nr:hypothetical protein [Vicinamibacterales bacterium]
MDNPAFVGTFSGTGTWHDAAGKSGGYRIRQTNLPTAEGLEVAFRHDFDDGSVVEAAFNLASLVPHLFRVDISGAAVGNGYMFGDICHYHMKFGDKFVEVTYRTGDGELSVFGSSSTNAEGNYIAWRETLRRVTG